MITEGLYHGKVDTITIEGLIDQRSMQGTGGLDRSIGRTIQGPWKGLLDQWYVNIRTTEGMIDHLKFDRITIEGLLDYWDVDTRTSRGMIDHWDIDTITTESLIEHWRRIDARNTEDLTDLW